MKTRDLNEIMKEYSEVPSEHCWSSLEQQLSVVLPTDSTGISASQQGGSLATKIAASSGKIIVLSSVSIVTAGAVLFSVLHKKPISNSFEEIHRSTETVALVSDTTRTVDTLATVNSFVEKPKTMQNQEQSAVPAVSVVPVQIQSQTPSISQTVSSVNTHAEEVTSISTPIPSAIVSSSTTSTTTSNISQHSAVNQSDPVLSTITLPESKVVKISIPNVFTPNQDGYNDLFVISGIEQCDESRLTIRSASGRVVFDKMNYRNDWMGSDLPDGIYNYVFVYKTNGITEKMSGKVVIERGY